MSLVPTVVPAPATRGARPEPSSLRTVKLAGMVALAVAAFLLLFQVITLVLSRVPDPIGPHAAEFTEGAQTTLLLTLASAVVGLAVGAVAGLSKISNLAVVRLPATFYVWVVRGTPLLVQVLFVYLALPAIFPFLKLSDFNSGVVALGLNVGAYNAEVFRAGILGVPRGQTEAARSLGLSGFRTLWHVVLPQAFRLAVPPLVNNLVALLKDSSLVSVIGLLELTTVGNRLQSQTFLPVPVLATTACVYLAMTTVLTIFTNHLEGRMAAGTKRA
ncbi:MAG TPA: amino acid ABC transporter permease [Deinococcales bacterium]|nr:amino acid ABC transporter permease [Deinococcales bacterium]